MILYQRRGAPTGSRWRWDEQWSRSARLAGAIRAVGWRGYGLAVLADRIEAEYQGLVVPHIHVSVAVDSNPRLQRRRPTDPELAFVRAEFDIEDAEEDNHSPGVARHLFLPLHLPRGSVGVCECKADEEQVVEPDGYRWSRVLS